MASGLGIDQLFSRVTTAVQSQINSLTKWTLKLQSFSSGITQKIQEKVNKFIRTLTKKPASKEDYWRVLGFYLAKKFVVTSLAAVGAVFYLYVSFLVPMLEGKLWKAKIRTDTEKYQQFSGKAKVFDSGGVFIYDGEMNSGKPQGFGIQYSAEGKLIYKGKFKQGQYAGEGELYDASENTIYTGEFKDNKFEGSGKKLSSFGTVIFNGNFEKGMRSGRGTEYDAQTGLRKYYGEFASDKFEGRGLDYQSDGEIIKYEGDFKEGLYNGKGKKYKDKRLVYSGSFANGKYEGDGVLYDESSGVAIYSGEFKNDLYDGSGALYDKETMRMVYEGEFSNGKRSGEGTMYDSLGTPVFSGKFRDDSIDFISVLGKKIDEVTEFFGAENSRIETGDRTILTYLSINAAVILKSDVEELICEKIITGIKYDFMGLGSKSTAMQRRQTLGEPFSSLILKTSQPQQKIFSLLNITVSDPENIYCDKYNFNDYFIRLIFSAPDRAELRAVEIGSMQ
jgi:hypothetical protein